MNEYWTLKKRMAPGCEPVLVANMMATIKPYVCGMCLAGAGGGGFMYVITNGPGDREKIHEALSNLEVTSIALY